MPRVCHFNFSLVKCSSSCAVLVEETLHTIETMIGKATVKVRLGINRSVLEGAYVFR